MSRLVEMTAAHSPGLRAQQCSCYKAALGYPQSQCVNSELGNAQRRVCLKAETGHKSYKLALFLEFLAGVRTILIAQMC